MIEVALSLEKDSVIGLSPTGKLVFRVSDLSHNSKVNIQLQGLDDKDWEDLKEGKLSLSAIGLYHVANVVCSANDAIASDEERKRANDNQDYIDAAKRELDSIRDRWSKLL